MANFVTVEGRALKQAMTIVRSVIERRNTIPILGFAKLTHNDAGLRITGTDLDMEIGADIDVIDGAGGEWSICLNAATLASIARVAGRMNIRIELGEADKATITLGDKAAIYEVSTLPETDYPSLDGARGDLIETFTNGMLAATLGKVAWCVSTEEVRYYLNGVCWHMTADDRRFVATDGHRMAICQYAKEGAEPASRIIPRKTVAIIAEHFARQDVSVFALDNPNRLDFTAPGLVLRTKLIDGSYPDYHRVVPAGDRQAFAFDMRREEMMTAIDHATALGGDRQTAVKFYNAGGVVAINRRAADFGTATVTTTAPWARDDYNKVDAPTFGFNGRYLREVAGRCSGRIKLRMIDAGSPFSIHDDDETMTRVLMPMRA
jgi:DNA polymerase-3 subunit beta